MTGLRPGNLIRRIVHAMPASRGAIDLASVMVGVIILAIASTVIIASVISAVPWSKQVAAKANLSSVQVAESAARVATGSYLTVDQLRQQGFLAKPNTSYTAEATIRGGRGLTVLPRNLAKTALPDIGAPLASVGNGGACYVAAVAASDGLVYWLSSDDTTIRTTNPKNPAPDTQSCAPFPPVAAFPGPPLSIDYPSATFDAAKSGEKLTPTYSGGNGSAPEWNYTGTLPPGVTFDKSTGTLTGTTWSMSAISVAAGADTVCAVTNTGGVKCWGYNYQGQLGNGNVGTNSLTPVDVLNGDGTKLTKAKKVAVGGGFSGGAGWFACAITDQTVSNGIYCWGYNGQSALGDTTFSGSNRPYAYPVRSSSTTELTGASDISAGLNQACAIVGTTAQCWGKNDYYQLGATTPALSKLPVVVPGNFVRVSTGELTTCGITTGGGVMCWGDNSNGVFGNGASSGKSAAPVQATGLTSGATDISVGYHSACAIVNSALSCWGKNESSTLNGNAAVTSYLTPSPLAEVTEQVISVEVGVWDICAVTTAGAGKCWGGSTQGRLGNGNSAQNDTATPQQVLGLESGASAMAMAYKFGCGIASGTLYCWGGNDIGQMGDGSLGTGTTGQHYTPTKVNGFAGTPGFPADITVSATDGSSTATKPIRIGIR